MFEALSSHTTLQIAPANQKITDNQQTPIHNEKCCAHKGDGRTHAKRLSSRVDK